MSIWYNHVRVDISLDKLRENYLFLSSKAGRIMPVIKSDAYGHGLGAVASCLARAGADMLAVVRGVFGASDIRRAAAAYAARLPAVTPR